MPIAIPTNVSDLSYAYDADGRRIAMSRSPSPV
jgi:hypothetical protein